MEDEFLKPSPEALERPTGRFVKKHHFPFDRVPVGMSFAVKHDEIKSYQSLRVLASKKGIELGKVFKVIDHGEESGYEVFCQRNRA